MTTVLAAVFPNNKERLYYLQEKIEADFFSGHYHDLWQIINRIGVITGGEVATAKIIHKSLDQVIDMPIERRAAIDEVLDDILNFGEVKEADFKASVEFLVEEYRRNKLGEGLTEAMEVLSTGIRHGQDLVYGVDPAIDTLHASISEIEQISHGVMPEGNVFDERSELLKELHDDDALDRALTHIRPLDEVTIGGAGLGELWLIAAYAGVGKTFFCTNLAYTMSVFGGANVVYLTAETGRKQVRRRLLGRHTHHPKFNFPNGLSSDDFKKHKPSKPVLTPAQLEQWTEVIEDFTEDHDDRGILHVAQIPMGAKVSTIHAKLNKLNSVFPVDVVIIDSLDLLTPDVRRTSEREEFNDILARTKSLATTFDNGRGLRIISPWQIRREAWEQALKEGRYSKSALGDTAQTERKADLILSLLEDPNHEFKLKAQILKFRDSSTTDFDLEIDYARAYVGSADRAGSSFEADLLEAQGFDDF